MKNLVIASMLTLTAAAGSAFAYAPNELPATYAYTVRTFVPGADLSNLSTAQVGQIETILTSSSYDYSDIAGALRQTLKAQ